MPSIVPGAPRRPEELLQSMHLDHTHDIDNVCAVWRDSVPRDARTWSVGIDHERLCRMLFGVTSANQFQVLLKPIGPHWQALLPSAASALRAGDLRSSLSVTELIDSSQLG